MIVGGDLEELVGRVADRLLNRADEASQRAASLRERGELGGPDAVELLLKGRELAHHAAILAALAAALVEELDDDEQEED